MAPRTALSGNTLSLKFMNRGNPSSAPAPKSTAAPAASSSSSKPSTSRSIANNSTDGEWFIPGWEDSLSVLSTGSSSSSGIRQAKEDKIEVEDSYLPFLLEKDTARKSLGNGGTEAEKEDVGGKGGRRSFGGINRSIEKLSRPTELSILTPGTPKSDSTTPTSVIPTSQTASAETQNGFLRPSGFTSPPSTKKIEKSVLSHLQSSTGARSTTPSSVNSSRSSTPASSTGMKRFPPLSKKKRKSDTISSSASESDDDEEEEEDKELQKLYDSVLPNGARGGSTGQPRTGRISSGGRRGARKPQDQGKRMKKPGGSA